MTELFGVVHSLTNPLLPAKVGPMTLKAEMLIQTRPEVTPEHHYQQLQDGISRWSRDESTQAGRKGSKTRLTDTPEAVLSTQHRCSHPLQPNFDQVIIKNPYEPALKATELTDRLCIHFRGLRSSCSALKINEEKSKTNVIGQVILHTEDTD